MKIEVKNGELVKKYCSKFTNKTGELKTKCTIIVKTGDSDYGAETVAFDIFKETQFELIKNIKIGEKIEVAGFLNCRFGESEKGNYAFNSVNLSFIKKLDAGQPTPPPPTENDDDLPF